MTKPPNAQPEPVVTDAPAADINGEITDVVRRDANRDKSGRFVAGNSAAVGRRKKNHALRDALADAVTPEDVQALGAALVDRAKRGDVDAARLVLDRLLGRPRVAEREPVVLDLPNVVTDEGALAAIGALVAAVACGEIGTDSAHELAGVIAEARRLGKDTGSTWNASGPEGLRREDDESPDPAFL